MRTFDFKDDALRYIEKNYRYIDFAKFKVSAYFVTTGNKCRIIRVEGRVTSIYGKGGQMYANVFTPHKVQWSVQISVLDPTSLCAIATHLAELNGDL